VPVAGVSPYTGHEDARITKQTLTGTEEAVKALSSQLLRLSEPRTILQLTDKVSKTQTSVMPIEFLCGSPDP